jgi:hypothetical protein
MFSYGEWHMSSSVQVSFLERVLIIWQLMIKNFWGEVSLPSTAVLGLGQNLTN